MVAIEAAAYGLPTVALRLAALSMLCVMANPVIWQKRTIMLN